MAGTNSAAFSFLRPITNTRPNQLLLFAYTPTPSKPVKFTKRRNSLRPKILKLPTKPYSPPNNPFLPENQVIPIIALETPSQELPPSQSSRSYSPGAREDEFRASETTGDNGAVGEPSGRYFLKFGVYLIGAFLLQTVYAVWVLANQIDLDKANSDSGKGRVLLNRNEKGLSSNLGSESSNVVSLDESQLEEKIEEIRGMAKQARKVEKNGYKKESGSKNGDFDKSLKARNRIGIEKEIKTRLLKLQKSLSSDKEKLPGLNVNYLSNSEKKVEDGVRETSLDERKGNESMVFKKKFKFRSPSIDPRKSIKGFGDSGKNKGEKGKRSGFSDKIIENGSVHNDEMELLEKENEEIHREKGFPQNDWNNLDKGVRRENGGKKVSQRRSPRNGVFQESKLGKPSLEVPDSREMGMESDKTLLKENRETMEECNDHLVSSRNGSSRRKVAEKKSVSNKVRDRQSHSETDMWWLNLPYVLVVLMHRGTDPDGPGGLYTLNPSPEAHELTDSSYTVAFADRGDATNFCFLLESFFEDLGDVRADIVPLSIKELQAAVNSEKLKVIVVKKGQLQLYAGQPFADVEMALHSLVKEIKTVD